MKIIKIGAVWCNGCVVMRPIWKEIEEEIKDLNTVYYDYDMDEDKLENYTLGDILPIFIFENDQGIELERLIGEQSKERLIQTINKYKGM